ncbi:hypothetical protein HYV64_03995 [Candidatus Shapirobacteria bacterium]|nr:hypothetical protein [Candidatus Shapirobacteria bacterium]
MINLVWGLGWILTFPGQIEAYLGKVEGYMSPSTEVLNVGEKLSTKVMLNTGSSKLSVVYLNLQIDTSRLKVTSVIVNRNVFSGVYMEKESGGVVSIYGTSSKPTGELPSGVVEVGTIEMEALEKGNVMVGLKNYEITGPSNSNDYSYQLAWQVPTYVVDSRVMVTPTEVVGNGTNGILKFRMAYSGVMEGSSCSNDWPVNVTVMSGGQSKIYDKVSVVEDGGENGKKIFKGEVLLDGFTPKQEIAVFLKGPKHIQVKYGRNGQSDFYNEPGGSLSVESNSATTPIYDLTGYPLMAGDVVGRSSQQDGVVDGLDFSYVKTEVNKRTEGNGLLADMNGNCKLESQDLTLLMLAMKDKQEQLY